jgi:hypothetical protein
VKAVEIRGLWRGRERRGGGGREGEGERVRRREGLNGRGRWEGWGDYTCITLGVAFLNAPVIR